MNDRLKLLFVFGTRPEVIKMAPVIRECRKFPERITVGICITGQHRQMIDPLLDLFNIRGDYDLDIMQENQDLEHITATVLKRCGEILKQEQPDYLVVQGDTTTAMAAALAAFYQKIKVAHVEAGLRTWDKYHPYPEEINRKVIDGVSDLYFAHTDKAKENLLKEGVREADIEVTGNTVIDALLETAGRPFDLKSVLPERFLQNNRRIILVTAHRRENFGEPIRNICGALKELAERFQDEIGIVYPVHLNPNIQSPVRSLLDGVDNVCLAEPLEYLPFVHLMKASHIVLTDSGGLQEEAPSLGKPVLVMRQTTERPEGVEAGCVKVIGTETGDIVKEVTDLLRDEKKVDRMARAANPYGDGQAGPRIVLRILKREGRHEP